jgi:hypothetical protein
MATISESEIEIKQLEPIAPLVASVQVHFKVYGILPDIVQIYAELPSIGDDLGELKAEVSITPPGNEYVYIIELKQGLFIILLFVQESLLTTSQMNELKESLGVIRV